TVAVIEAERAVRGITERGVAVGAGTVSAGVVARVLGEVAASGFELGEDQKKMIENLAKDGHRVSLVTAPAGSGKTTALRYYRQVLEAGGYYPIGASTSGKAARELEN